MLQMILRIVYLYEDSESIEQLIIFLNKMKKNEYIDEAANICSSPKGIDWQMNYIQT